MNTTHSTPSRARSLIDRGRSAACSERAAGLAYFALLITLAVFH